MWLALHAAHQPAVSGRQRHVSAAGCQGSSRPHRMHTAFHEPTNANLSYAGLQTRSRAGSETRGTTRRKLSGLKIGVISGSANNVSCSCRGRVHAATGRQRQCAGNQRTLASDTHHVKSMSTSCLQARGPGMQRCWPAASWPSRESSRCISTSGAEQCVKPSSGAHDTSLLTRPALEAPWACKDSREKQRETEKAGKKLGKGRKGTGPDATGQTKRASLNRQKGKGGHCRDTARSNNNAAASHAHLCRHAVRCLAAGAGLAGLWHAVVLPQSLPQPRILLAQL